MLSFWLPFVLLIFLAIGMPVLVFIWMRKDDPFNFEKDDEFYILCGALWFVSVPFVLLKDLGKWLDKKNEKDKD